jgi:prepilin-type N-terminal cleavage/methylation domain-containing protein
MTRTTKRSARRAGFTLVEMLVVVTIIGILLTLTTAAVLQTIATQQTTNTQSTLTRLQGDLVRAYRSASDKFRKEPIPTSGAMNNAYYNVVMPMANNDKDRARVIWTKLRLKQTFPNNFSEALSPTPLPALSYYTTKLGAVGLTTTNTLPTNAGYQTKPWESSVCLLLALQRGEDGPALKESDIGTGSLKDFGQIALNPKDPSSGPTPLQLPIKGLVDGWGTPLDFCRWPLNSPLLNPNGQPQSGDNNDSDDPSGLLESAAWQTMSGGTLFTQFQQFCHPVPQHTASTEAKSFRVYPLIVSAGPDKRLGLDKEPVGTTAPFPLQFPQPSPYFFAVQAAPFDQLAKDNIYPQLSTSR